ncbi:uncharacterized protein ISCGN_030158 [Ixodes scapularis]
MMSGGNTVSATGRVNPVSSDNSTSDYKVILPRFPTGNLILNSVFLHADISARPYSAPDFRDALKDVIDLRDVKATGQYQMSHIWMVTCTNALAKAKLCQQRELLVKGRKCLVIDPDTRDIKIKIIWLPDHLEDRRVAEALQAYGTVRSMSREKWRCPGMEHMDTLNREVNITLHDDITIEKVPHLLKIFGCQCLLLVPGRPPLCLRCNRVGHVRRQCKTPRCFKCGRYGHTTDTCVTTYASKLLGPRTQEAEEQSELLMDVTEVLDASGHTPPASTIEKFVEQEHPRAAPAINECKDDPGGLSEPPPPDEDGTSSSSSESTIVGEVVTECDDEHDEADAEPTIIPPASETSRPTDEPEGTSTPHPTKSPSSEELPSKRSKKDRQPAGMRHKPYSKLLENLKGTENSH